MPLSCSGIDLWCLSLPSSRLFHLISFIHPQNVSLQARPRFTHFQSDPSFFQSQRSPNFTKLCLKSVTHLIRPSIIISVFSKSIFPFYLAFIPLLHIAISTGPEDGFVYFSFLFSRHSLLTYHSAFFFPHIPPWTRSNSFLLSSLSLRVTLMFLNCST